MTLKEIIENAKKDNTIDQINVLTNDYDFIELLDGEMHSKFSDLEVSDTFKERNMLFVYVNACVVGVDVL